MKNTKELVDSAMKEMPRISCSDYKMLQVSNEPHILLDVREKDEWDIGHIEKAIHIPRGLLEFKVQEEIPNDDAYIIVYCAKGGRSALAAKTLNEIGYRHVEYLEGGKSGLCGEAL